MRTRLAAAIILSLLASSAHAGTFSVDEKGQLLWQPSRCQPPTSVPPSLLEADRESKAGDMNQRAAQYNAYVQLTQTYMNCVSTEAEQDAAVAGAAVTAAGQGIIDGTQKDLEKIGAAVKERPE